MRSLTITCRSEDWEPTGWPPAEVITSPALSPALAAGPPETTPAIGTPEPDAGVPPLPNPDPGTPELFCPILTPRNAVGPTCTPPPEWPSRIWVAIPVATLMGIANPAPVCWEANWEVCEPAMSIPITCPAALTSGPPESPA